MTWTDHVSDRYVDESETDLYTTLYHALRSGMDGDWERGTVEFTWVDDDVYQLRYKSFVGDQKGFPDPPRAAETDTIDVFKELARRMHEGGAPRWKTATFATTPEGEFSIDYEYEDEGPESPSP